MLIDFKEINDDHAFEYFAKLFLEACGLKVEVTPAKGPDGGRDIICSEITSFGQASYRWLVSCKHFAHSGKSVGQSDDQANHNKLIEHQCHGFMFIYSTAFTESLRTSVVKVCETNKANHKFLTPWDIENIIVKSPRFYPLLNQFFPNSHSLLIETIENQGSCCSQDTSDIPGYIFYRRDSDTHRVSAVNVCGYCIESYIEHFDSNNLDYSFYQVRDLEEY
ncbi:restriction endonuclease [Vibrio parahaemolyticus]